MNDRELPIILSQTVELSLQRALRRRAELQALPIAAFTYRDDFHQMLTLTVILLPHNQVQDFRENLSNRGWEYLPQSWHDITRIDVPHLTAKERLYIEERLFLSEENILHEQLPFRLDEDDVRSLQMMLQFARHYRRYPSFFPVLL